MKQYLHAGKMKYVVEGTLVTIQKRIQKYYSMNYMVIRIPETYQFLIIISEVGFSSFATMIL